jgi:DHA2 family multidrug resistance protein
MSAADASAVKPRAAEGATSASSGRLLLTIAIMASTVMQAIDTTIVNVSLPYMQGQLGATSDEISWVFTSYLVASAIMMPLTGFFTDRLGRKRYLMGAILGFVIASMLCGLAQNLPQIVIFRLLQGAFGAALVPLAQALLADTYPPEQRGKAMAIWSMGVMIGPIMGPTLGGWLTEILSWRWSFYVNLPIGIASLMLVSRYCPDTPRRQRSMDWVGLALISLAVGGTQMVLDRGNEDDWFSSHFIVVTTMIAAMSLAGFIAYALTTARKPVFDITVLRDRNFLASGLVTTLMSLGMFGSTFVQPILLEKLLDYPALTAGLMAAPRGIATMFSMRLAGSLIGRFDTRAIVTAGVLACAVGSFSLVNIDLSVDAWAVIWPSILQGLGIGLVYVPLATLQLATLRPDQMSEGAGLGSLMRTMGQSIGVSIVSTLMTRLGQKEWVQLGGHLNPYNPALQAFLGAHHLRLDDPMTASLLSQELARQSQMLALVNVMEFIGWSCLAMLAFVPLVKPVRTSAADVVLVVE